MKKFKAIPKFKYEQKESKFWTVRDSAEYIDWSKSKKAIFPNLKPSSKSVPIRFPSYLLDRLRLLANKRHVPYQALIKIFLAERVDKELQKTKS